MGLRFVAKTNKKKIRKILAQNRESHENVGISSTQCSVIRLKLFEDSAGGLFRFSRNRQVCQLLMKYVMRLENRPQTRREEIAVFIGWQTAGNSRKSELLPFVFLVFGKMACERPRIFSEIVCLIKV